ncbi:MAG: hypothetical protein WBC14_12425, partial [Propionicimonas sp.]
FTSGHRISLGNWFTFGHGFAPGGFGGGLLQPARSWPASRGGNPPLGLRRLDALPSGLGRE